MRPATRGKRIGVGVRRAKSSGGVKPGQSSSPIQTPALKKTIERAYSLSLQFGIQVWCEDEAGPYQTSPYAGHSWQPQQRPLTYSHEYLRNGTAKLLTIFQPATGHVRVKGVTDSTNVTLHAWLKDQLTAILADQPLVMPPPEAVAANRLFWE